MATISNLIKELIENHYKYILQCEKNSTEMKRQAAFIKAKTKILQANTECAEKYFRYQVRERERLFESASKLLDQAIKTSDTEIARIAIKTIEIIHNKSPFSF